MIIKLRIFYNKNTMNKILFTSYVLLFSFLLSGCSPLLEFNEGISQEFVVSFDNEEIVKNEAKALLEQRRHDFTDYEWAQGPCLGMINDEWVVDISHNPRIPEDDREENQCQEYYDGIATHFIEIAPDGQILKVE